MADALRLGLPRERAFKRLGSTAGLAAKTSSRAASEWLTRQLSTPAAGVMSPMTPLAMHLAVICKHSKPEDLAKHSLTHQDSSLGKCAGQGVELTCMTCF